MSRYFCYKLSFLLINFFIISCATYDAQYSSKAENWVAQTNEINNEIDHTFYLIGDAGNAKENKSLNHLKLLKNELVTASKNSTVLFLGDNIYEKGLPKKEHPTRLMAEHRLNVQIDLVKNFKGQPIFIPGNHDYYSNGIKGLKRQENYITKHLKSKNSFLPKDGCPLKKVTISNDIVLIIVDSQWYLENWDANPTMNDNCEIKTRKHFFEEFESLIKKNTTKTIVIAIHHPMFSNGSHGGQYSLKKQIYPTSNKIPLPILGTVANLLRKTSGISPQDMMNPFYLELKKRLITISQKSEKIIFVSGHEHNLQYILKDNKPQIISGSGSKISAARTINGGQFSYGGLGYAKLVVYKNGATWVNYYTEIDGTQKLLFKTQIYQPTVTETGDNYSTTFPKTILASVYTKKEVSKGKTFTGFWGEHYRKYYGTKVTAPTVLLDTLFGGLTPTRKGGGNQSRSLRLEDKNGKEFVMRALRKSATQYLQAVAFKDQYIEGQFDNTYTEGLLLDVYTTAHPYAPFTIGKLADAVKVYHTNPTLYYIPKQNALKQFNATFGNELYMIEERVTSGHADVESFGFSNEIISTDDLLKKLRKTDNNIVDEDAYIRARLFDMLIGDWDRHEDQWRWAEFKEGNKKKYKPVPRDRDQAFSKYDGFILGFITRAIPALKLMQVYDTNIRNIKWFNAEPYPLDMALINNATLKNWLTQVVFIQENITNKVIENAFNQLPNEVKDGTVNELETMLKGRLKILPEIAEKYFQELAKYGVVKGNDKNNLFKIKQLKNNKTLVKVFDIKKNGKKGTIFFKKTYSKKFTKEIWIYGLDGKDKFEVTGNYNSGIKIRLIGGQNNDVYDVRKGNKVTIYDFKTKKNTFLTNKGKLKLTNSYQINNYDYKKLKYNQNQIMPIIGANPDDGFKIGINDIYTIYGFERNPFTQQHSFKAAYFFANKGFDFGYNAEFANLLNHWNFLLETRLTSPNFTINYYGFGNETSNFENQFGDDYHRVRLSTYAAYPSLKWVGRFGAKLKFGPLLESIAVEKTPDRFINTISSISEKRKIYLGAKITYHYQNYDNKTFPTLGMATSFEMGWKTNLTNNSENFWYVAPSLSFDYKLTPNGNIVLATKLKGNIIMGTNFEFYNAASIGGLDGLRGYRNQRFTGNQSFYQNTDVRFNLRTIKTSFAPIQYGIYGGFDYGRIWLKNETSNDWKTSVGGGFWLIVAKLINLNVSAFSSKDGTYARFGLGFGF
ncbi:metallophosphoesterase [Lutibacter sp.]|uniref:metallophosphoesterase n=1 Tax=Lutibacter sp. TaxID=1925666 RepID=UPI0025BEB155|nr:metallophosphoesterase [Lutibacter sp.]MCF6169219.1 metallophosphoesterase [Lutibacter sp.]